MKKSSYPTVVNLKDLPQEGETFNFSRATGELDKTLADLIDNNDYRVDFELVPAGNAFAITGQIQTQALLTCARCGRDTTQPISDTFHEVIMVIKEKPRSGHSGHTGNNLIDGPYCHYTTAYEFDMGEFAREHVAAAIPYTPYCGRADCEEYLERAKTPAQDSFDSSTESNPFATLKNLTSKSQRS